MPLDQSAARSHLPSWPRISHKKWTESWGSVTGYQLGDDAFHVVETRVPQTFFDSLKTQQMDRMTAYIVPADRLEELNGVGQTGALNYVPLVNP